MLCMQVNVVQPMTLHLHDHSGLEDMIEHSTEVFLVTS
jgi:hypothetical protein